MTTPVQAVSEAGRAATISSLHIWDSLSQVAQAQILSHVYPSSAAMLGTSAAAAPLAYDAIDLVQTFSPTISVSGLNAAQQEDLTATLGLNANAASADVPGANKALLMPGGAAQVLVNVLVGDANVAAAKANPANPGLYNEQGVIGGVPGDGVSQARDAAMGALLNLGASGVTASMANPVSNTTGGVTENQFTVGTEVAPNNVSVANPHFTTVEQIAMAEYAAVMANQTAATAVAAVAAEVVVEAAPAAENASQARDAAMGNLANLDVSGMATSTAISISNTTGSVAENQLAAGPEAAANNVPAAGLNLTTAGQAAMAEYAAVMANPAGATSAASVVPEIVLATENVSAANPNFATAEQIAMAEYAAVMANPAAATASAVNAKTAATAVVGEAAVITDAASATNELQQPGNLPTAETKVNIVQTATAAATTPTVAELGATAKVSTPPAVAPVMARAAPTATTATTDAAPEIRFDNTRSILQSLLAEAVAHATIQGDSASATYSVGGAMFQMGTGADHVQQYTMKDYLPDIPDIVRPISPIARIRGVAERKT